MSIMESGKPSSGDILSNYRLLLPNPKTETHLYYRGSRYYTVNKHQHYLSVKAQDYITYTPLVDHAVLLRIGGIPLVTNS